MTRIVQIFILLKIPFDYPITMLEIVCGCATVVAWLVGLAIYPKCMDDMADCCERVFIQRDNSTFVINEASATFAHNTPDSDRGSPVVYNQSQGFFPTAKLVEFGDSPNLRSQSTVPIAKYVKTH